MNFHNSTFRIKVNEDSRPRLDRNKARLRRGGWLRASAPLKRKHRSKVETEWIAEVRERDNYTCRWPKCGYYSKHIHAHHIHTRAQRPDLKWVVGNGACLCFKHHDYAHHNLSGRKKARELGLLGTATYEQAMKGQTA